MFDGPGRHGREEMTTELRSADSPFKPEDLQRLEQLRGAFQPRRFGSGYDPAQVDRIFDAMSSNMTGRSPVPVSDKELDTSQFSLVQRGYFEAEVDAALREIRDIFAKRGMVRLSDERTCRRRVGECFRRLWCPGLPGIAAAVSFGNRDDCID